MTVPAPSPDPDFSSLGGQPDPLAWDFLDPRDTEPEPLPGDFWVEDDLEDWLEDF